MSRLFSFLFASAVAFAFALESIQAISEYDDGDEAWHAYRYGHNKTYANNHSENAARENFRRNVGYINRHNAQYRSGKQSYRLAVNYHVDMSSSEFRAVRLGYVFNVTPTDPSTVSRATRQAAASLPASVDWRMQGWVTGVKDQGYACGCCWTFSSTGALEAQVKNVTGNLVSLSEQNLLDCVGFGCGGGNMQGAFNYIVKNGGIDTEALYPFVGTVDTCQYNSANVGARMSSWNNVANNEAALQLAVATIGPISAGMDASLSSFAYYSSGIYNDASCSSTTLDHAVLVIGYGTTSSGQQYWIVKNSWGTGWGQAGYFQLQRGVNRCGISNTLQYPIAVGSAVTTAMPTTTTTKAVTATTAAPTTTRTALTNSTTAHTTAMATTPVTSSTQCVCTQCCTCIG